MGTRTRYFKWKENTLYYDRRKMSAIQPDPDWPGMWRVIEESGSLSDMVNLSRAKDAARARATGKLERLGKARQAAQEAPE